MYIAALMRALYSAEVAKTRMQLQGELVKSGGTKVYKNVADVLIKTWRNEGIRGVQRGLGPAVRFMHKPTVFILTIADQYFYQWALNGTRLGELCSAICIPG